MSTDGAGHVPIAQLQASPVVIAAFDNDQAGEQMVERLRKNLPTIQHHSPAGKDWNEDLQLHLRDLQRQFEQRSSRTRQFFQEQVDREDELTL
ncbi:toprim domain-containing protein [Microcoleus sp. FACHB-1515]|uniref:toprim domain-containing protein n=1 Tax=Cyanophyceae TaxID=3028117 RepID=UPI001685E326|nr:toprim domain-containing protein [Microcoleus sp. FACHB-1515]